jgi:putative glutamine amidotransferase
MSVHIAIPEPTTTDSAYNQRSLPQYLFALHAAGVTPVLVPLHERPDRVARLLLGVQGVLLPGSGFDVDPERYGECRIPRCGPADAGRTAVDELLLQDAFNLHKPVLGICHGAQTLNVWLNGSLVQDLKTESQDQKTGTRDFKTGIEHAPDRGVLEAHTVRVAPGSRLARLLQDGGAGEVPVNSSHHQAVKIAGDNLRVTAVSPQDGVIEAVELDSADHFVVGVQWHPERTYTHSAFSRAIFSAFIQSATAWQPRRAEESLAAR